MKHLQSFEAYISDEEQNINDILDRANQSDDGVSSLSDKELKTLKNKGKAPDWKSDLADSLSGLNDLKFDYKDDMLEVDEMTPEYLLNILDDIEKDHLQLRTARIKRLKEAFPEVTTNPELKEIYWKAIKNWYDQLNSSM